MKALTLKFVLTILITGCLSATISFAQSGNDTIAKSANPFSFLTIVKLDEVATKEDIGKVKDALRIFGNRIHSYKINFERRQVVIRMRQLVPNEDLVRAFRSAGYTAWYDEKEKIQPGDAAYRGEKK